MAQQDRAALAMAAFEAMSQGIATGDFAPFAAHLADDITLTFFGTTRAAGSFTGKELVLRWFRGVHRYFPDGLVFTVRNVMAGTTAAAIEWEDSGIAVGGQPYQNYGISVFEFLGDKVATYREYIDTERVKATFG